MKASARVNRLFERITFVSSKKGMGINYIPHFFFTSFLLNILLYYCGLQFYPF